MYLCKFYLLRNEKTPLVDRRFLALRLFSEVRILAHSHG